MTLLALLSDAYGANGGIAKVNRDLLHALTAHDSVERVDVLSRVPPAGDALVPDGVVLDSVAGGGGLSFVRATAQHLVRGHYGGVVCGHLHLAPLAALAAARAGVPWVLIVHGIEAWGPPYVAATQRGIAAAATKHAVRRADQIVSVSALTRDRLCARFGVSADRVTVVPNSVDLADFGPGPKRPDLAARYGLEEATVLMTLARLAPQERYKGVDEVMEVMPALADRIPDVSYLVCGGGDDRGRLEAKAAALGVGDRVVFAGFVPEAEKADHYRLADAFVMPGRGEGFGIVYLEALACGVPVVASSRDASQEAVLNGALGQVVDPDDPDSIVAGVLDALAQPGGVPEGLDHFSYDQFTARWHAVVDEVFLRPRGRTPVRTAGPAA